MRRAGWVLAALLAAAAAAAEPLPSIATATEGLTRRDGFLDFWLDPNGPRVLVAIERFDEDLLYLTALPHGVGSNDLGLDRGQLRDSKLVRFVRAGTRVLLQERNLRYRAESENPTEVASVEESFARSTLAGFDAVAADDGALLIDLAGLLVGDPHGVTARLAELDEGTYQLDPGRSAPDPGAFKNFPRNSVFEAWVTFAGTVPGEQARSVVPTPEALTVKLRHEFIALPEAGFERRAYHPRSGYFPLVYRDYAAPLGQPIERRVITRHRLRRGPGGAVQPLVYYVDSGAPEPVRSALVEGVAWWADAFAAAGFDDALRVEVLPEGADPLDLRYHVIQWVHRSTRGWSYGGSVVDPRTGEILKAHVSLGSLRVRQDMLLAEALTAPYAGGDEEPVAVREMALARLRQLAAHEVGHTLGVAHNFAASARDDASVMDYPHPFVRLNPAGEVVLTGSYSVGIGAWDTLAIEYGYREFSSPAERARGLSAILERGARQGLRFLSEAEARGIDAVHPGAHLWDNGVDPLARFDQLVAIRARALETFSEAVLRRGEPLAEMERKLVVVYLLHRYQAEAVAKHLAGIDYDYTLRGEPQTEVAPVAAETQRAALDRLLDSLRAETLLLPAGLPATLEPPPFGFERDREDFTHSTGAAFDAFAPARTAAQLIVPMILEPKRAQRLIQQHAQDPDLPGLPEVLDALTDRLLLTPINNRASDEPAALAREVAWIALREIERLAATPETGDTVRAVTTSHLRAIERRLRRGRDQARAMAAEIERFLKDPDPAKLPRRHPIPPGAPI